MKVAIALAGTDRGRSGIGVWVCEVVPRLLALLDARGDRAILVGTRADLDAYPLAREREQLVLPAMLDAPGPSAAFHLVGLLPLVHRAGADVVLLPAANRRLAVAGASVPTVAVVHDLAALTVRGKYDALRTAYVHGLARGLTRANVLVAVSASTAEHVTKVTRGATVRVVSNGVDARRFAPRAPDDVGIREAREALSLERPYVLYVSRLEHPGKNHVRLVRAFAASREAAGHDLVLAGPDWGAGERIRAEAERCDVADRVRIVGRVDDTLLPALVAGCDALAMVGLAEGFGLPALEALAAGRAVLAARAGALPEVVGELAALADPLDEHALSVALSRTLSDATLRARCANEGPAWAARHDWGRTADGILSALKDAA